MYLKHVMTQELTNWHEMEQLVAWRQRARWAVDAFGDLMRRIAALPEGPKKTGTLAKLGSKNVPGTLLHTYEWLYARASSADAWLWLPLAAKCRVEFLEQGTKELKQEFAAGGGLGQLPSGTATAMIVTGVVGLLGLGMLFFSNRTRPPTGGPAFAVK